MPKQIQAGAEILAQGVLLERLALYDRALERYRVAAASRNPAIRAEALRRESDVFRARCQWRDALERARESAYIAENSGLTNLITEAQNAEAAVYLTRGEVDAATALLQRVLHLTRDDRMQGIALQNLGMAAATEGRFTDAEAWFTESRQCFERADYGRGLVVAFINLGGAALELGDLDGARLRFERALGAAQRVEDLELVAVATLNSAECHALSDDFRRAEDLASTALGYFTTAGNHWRRVECLRLFGDMRLRQRDAATAERAYRNGLELARQIGAPVEEQVLTSRLESLVGAAD